MAHTRPLIPLAARIARIAASPLAALALWACGPAAPPAVPSRPAAPAPPPPSDLGSGAIGEVRSARFDVRFPLPDGAGWRVDEAGGPWLVATHAGASTGLLVRVWREGERMDRDACEAKARLWRDLPRREGSLLIERRRVDVPAGFDTVVEIRVADATPPSAVGPRAARRPGALGAPSEGFALAFGGWARRCFAFVAATRATGPDAERLVAVRLATVIHLSLEGLTLESELAPPAPRGPSP